METRKVLGIIFSLLFLGAFAFVLSWGVINFNKVKDGMSGTQIYDSEDINKAYQDGYDTALKDKEEYAELINGYRDTITTLNDNISQLNSQIMALTNSNNDYANMVNNLNSQKANLQVEIDKLKENKTENESTIDSLNSQISTLNSQITGLNSTINTNKETINSLNNQITGLNTQIANLNQSITNNDKTIANLRIEINSLNTQIIDLTNDKNADKNTIKLLNNQVSSLNEQIDSLSKQNDSYSQTIDDLNAQIKALSNEKNNLIIENTNYYNTISSLNNQIVNLQNINKQLENTNLLHQNTISSLNTQIANLNQQINDVTLQGQNNSSVIASLKAKITELEESISYYENYISSLESGEQIVVTFEYDGSVYNIQVVNKGSKLSVTTPENTSYKVFNGWKVNGEFIDLDTFTANNSTRIIADVTYSYDVIFKVDNTVVNSQIIVSGNSADAIENPAKTGYQFDGWSTDGTNIVDISKNKITENTTYYAIFTKLYNVTFVYEDITKSTQTIRNGDYATNISIDNTQYKIFNGWKVNGSIVNISSYKITADTQFVADITYKYDVVYKVDDTVYNSQIITKNNYPTLPTNPVKSGYEFEGWSLNGKDVINTSTLAITNNTTYVAVFTKLYKVNFIYEGETISTQSVKVNSFANSVSVNNTTYKQFNGWKVGDEFVDIKNYKITQDTTFVADITYKFDVKFVVDKVIYNSQIIVKDEKAILPNNPTKDGYEFDGWSIDGIDIVSDIASKEVTENITYKAVFTKLHTVMFMCNNKVIETQTIRNGNLATVPTNLVFDSYAITGWKVNDTLVDLTTYRIYEDTLIVAEIVYDEFIKTDVFDERIFDGHNTFVFTDGTVYASSSTKTYILDLPKIDNPNGGGNMSSATSPSGSNGGSFNYDLWQPIDDVVYYSHGSEQRNLTKGTTLKWSSRLSFSAQNLWKMNGKIYLTISSGSYVYNPTTDDFDEVTFNGAEIYTGRYIWQYNNKVYYSFGSSQYVLDKSTNTWKTMNWNGLTNFYGDEVWTDGESVYYSYRGKNFELDRSTNTWTEKTFTGVDSFNGSDIWVYKGNTYLSNSTGNYLFTKKAGANN